MIQNLKGPREVEVRRHKDPMRREVSGSRWYVGSLREALEQAQGAVDGRWAV